MSSLRGKVEAHVDISSSPEKFYGVFSHTLNHLSSICPGVIQAIHLVDGDWGELGSITHWNYMHDGHSKVVKLITESVDPSNNMSTYEVIGGDLKNEFNNFTFRVEATEKRGGSQARLTLGFLKLSDRVAHPHTLLQQGTQVFKAVDAYLTHA